MVRNQAGNLKLVSNVTNCNHSQNYNPISKTQFSKNQLFQMNFADRLTYEYFIEIFEIFEYFTLFGVIHNNMHHEETSRVCFRAVIQN